MGDFEKNLLYKWSTEMENQLNFFKEPILDEYCTGLIKVACNSFNQDIQVFFMTIDVTEQYIYLKEFRMESIGDPLFTICVVFFISSKLVGSGSELKITMIEDLLFKLSGKKYNSKEISSCEREILKVLDFRLPFTTILDDFNTFFEVYKRKYYLKDAITPLCISSLELLYMQRKKWFENIKELYSNEYTIFRNLMCSKFYLPVGILITAFRATNYQFVLNTDRFLRHIKRVTNIHPDHIYALSNIILNYIDL